jgi:hypothetical protein
VSLAVLTRDNQLHIRHDTGTSYDCNDPSRPLRLSSSSISIPLFGKTLSFRCTVLHSLRGLSAIVAFESAALNRSRNLSSAFTKRNDFTTVNHRYCLVRASSPDTILVLSICAATDFFLPQEHSDLVGSQCSVPPSINRPPTGDSS